MTNQKPVTISIPHPCTQSWDEMKPHDEGRYCDHCQKTVTDFSAWSDVALHKFFAKKSGYICGRFLSTQLNRPINIPLQPHSKLYRIAVALGLTILAAQGPSAGAKPKPLLTSQNYLTATPDTLNKTGDTSWVSISGNVADAKSQPVSGAFVQAYRNGEAYSGAFVDTAGNFLVDYLRPGVYDVVVFFGYGDSAVLKGLNVVAKHTKVAFSLPVRTFTFTSGGIGRYTEELERTITVDDYDDEPTPIQEKRPARHDKPAKPNKRKK